MMYDVEYLREAIDDLNSLDNSVKLHVIKAIEKVRKNPLPNYLGGMVNRLETKVG